MDLPWGDEKTIQFITNVGLLTSNGPYGDNIMACEWTHHVSYSPGLIAVCIGQGKATHKNIQKSKEFGISIAATDQNVVASIAGKSSGKNYNKIKALEELGCKFYKAKTINTLMVQDTVLNIECTIFKKISLGDHTMFVGKINEVIINREKQPLVYHRGKYWTLEKNIPNPTTEELERINHTIEKWKK